MMDHLSAGPMTHELRILYRNALIVVVQCVFTLRRRNLFGMALGRNLVVEDDLIRVIFTRKETKNYTAINWLVPDFLKPYLLRYLQEHRPVLLEGDVPHSSGSMAGIKRYGTARLRTVQFHRHAPARLPDRLSLFPPFDGDRHHDQGPAQTQTCQRRTDTSLPASCQ